MCYGYRSVLEVYVPASPSLWPGFRWASAGEARRPLVAIIEDDQAISLMYRLQLEQAEYDVALAMDGASGLSLIRERRPDLVVLDLRLPRMEGLDLLRELRSEGGFEGIPVIVVSNYADHSLVDEALALGAREYHVKSRLTPPQLAERIRTYLR